jgi:hypothetical protein
MEKPPKGIDPPGIWDLLNKFSLFRDMEAGFDSYSFQESQLNYAGVTKYQHPQLGTCYGILPNCTYLDVPQHWHIQYIKTFISVVTVAKMPSILSLNPTFSAVEFFVLPPAVVCFLVLVPSFLPDSLLSMIW